MSEPAFVVLREMRAADVPDVLDVQQPGAVMGLADVFPQDEHPFPRELVADRWRIEIATPGIDCLVVVDRDRVAGFAGVRGAQLLHFGIALELWGTGLAQTAHAAVLDRMRARGIDTAWLRVFTDNRRGRRFYERLGWRETSDRSRSDFPPHPELVRYERDLTEP